MVPIVVGVGVDAAGAASDRRRPSDRRRRFDEKRRSLRLRRRVGRRRRRSILRGHLRSEPDVASRSGSGRKPVAECLFRTARNDLMPAGRSGGFRNPARSDRTGQLVSLSQMRDSN